MKAEKKYKRGFIAGMFDIFHTGHLNMIKIAKAHCDYLIVAIGTDDLYRIRKKREPIMPFCERRDIIAAIRYVDEVVSVSDVDKISAYNKYKFNAIFVGEDYESDDIYIKASEELKKLDVDVIYVKRLNISSTILRKYFEK